MIKVGKLIEAIQQLCYAHGILLAVLDVLYKCRDRPTAAADLPSETEENEGDDSDDDDSHI